MKAGLVGMTYTAMLVVFLAIELLWLGVIARRFYLSHLGRFFAERVNWAAAFVFYLLFLAGMMIFAVQPALEQNSLSRALVLGALYGLFTYATYDLTNLANFKLIVEKRGFAKAPAAPQMFGNAGREHMERYGTTAEQFAKIGWKNHKHSVNNPYSQFQDEYSLEDVLKAPMVYEPLTKLQCCPTSEGAGAAILASEAFVKKHGLEKRAIEIAGQAMATDFDSSFSEQSMIKMVGFDMTKKAAEKVYAQSGLGPENVDVVELHDCFSCNELITYEALGLCPVGHGGKYVDEGAFTYGGKVVVNPSGGLICPLTRIAAYSAAKAGVSNFTQWLAVHMAQNYSPEIRVNAIAPGFFVGEQNRKLLLNKTAR